MGLWRSIRLLLLQKQSTSGFFSAEVWDGGISKNGMAKHKISLLGMVGEKHTDETAVRYEAQRARY